MKFHHQFHFTGTFTCFVGGSTFDFHVWCCYSWFFFLLRCLKQSYRVWSICPLVTQTSGRFRLMFFQLVLKYWCTTIQKKLRVWHSHGESNLSPVGRYWVHSKFHISDTRIRLRLVYHFFFLPHFDVICDLLLNRRTTTWDLFVK